IEAFDDLPSDNYLLGQQEIATQQKDVARENCEVKARVVFTAVENIWGIDSPEYHLFSEDKAMSKLTDAELYRFMKDFAKSTEDNLAELATEGITAADVTELRAFRSVFDDKLSAQRQAIKNRNIGNNARIKKGNELYALLVKHTNTGKNIWLNVNEAKYNDYVIYPTSTGNNYEVFEGEILSPGIVNVDTGDTVITSTTNIKQFMTGTGGRGFFSDFPGNPPGPGQAFMDVEGGTNQTGEAGADLGYQEGTRIILSVQNIGMTPGTYKFWVYIS
ncbi:MAG: hypothetical protein V4615_13780, partial [Bacteroidota bacterium]